MTAVVGRRARSPDAWEERPSVYVGRDVALAGLPPECETLPQAIAESDGLLVWPFSEEASGVVPAFHRSGKDPLGSLDEDEDQSSPCASSPIYHFEALSNEIENYLWIRLVDREVRMVKLIFKMGRHVFLVHLERHESSWKALVWTEALGAPFGSGRLVHIYRRQIRKRKESGNMSPLSCRTAA